VGLACRLLVLLASTSVWDGAAAQQRTLDQGTLLVTRGAAPISREEFTVQAGRPGAPDGYTISARVWRLDRPGPVFRPQVELGPDSQPAAAQFDVSGDESRRIVAQVGNRRLTVRALTQSGESIREFPAADRMLVADDSALALYAVPPGREQGVVAIVWLRSGRRETWQLEDRGRTLLTIGAAQRPAHHLVLTRGSGERHLWYDDAGRLQRVEIPADTITAVRQLPE
jgi:hypothetical protein